MKKGGGVPASDDWTEWASPRLLAEGASLLPALHRRCAGSAFDRISGALDDGGAPRHGHRNSAAHAAWHCARGIETFGLGTPSHGQAGRASTRLSSSRSLHPRHPARRLKTMALRRGSSADLQVRAAATIATSHATRSASLPPVPCWSLSSSPAVEAATLCRGNAARLGKTMSDARREASPPDTHSQDRLSLSTIETGLRTSTTSRCIRRRSPLIHEERGPRARPARQLGYPRLPREARLLYSRDAQWGGGAAERQTVRPEKTVHIPKTTVHKEKIACLIS